MASKKRGSVDTLEGSALHRALETAAGASAEGFDWPDATGPLAKLVEEIEELQEAFHSGDRKHMESELGDVLFAAVNAARHLCIDPEIALEGTCERFSFRWKWVRSVLAARGLSMNEVTPDELESLWQQAKRA